MAGQIEINPLDSLSADCTPAEAQFQGASFAHIAELHVDEIANLWTIWSCALDLPQYNTASLSELESRIQKHIVGMRLQEQVAWNRCVGLLGTADAGEIFTAAQLAFRSYDVNKIKKVVQAAEANPPAINGLIEALVWMPFDIAQPWIDKFLVSKYVFHKYIAVEASRRAVRYLGNTPADLLRRTDCLECRDLVDSLIRYIGEFKQLQFVSLIERLRCSGVSDFWCLYSLALLRRIDDISLLKPFVFEKNPYQHLAIQLVFRMLPMDEARIWVSEMVIEPQWVNTAIAAVAVLGDPHAVPWLIGLMQQQECARQAGEAFSLITGIDLELTHLTIDAPPGELDNILALGVEEHEEIGLTALPWPDAIQVWDLWQNHMTDQFKPGYRYLMGKLIDQDTCYEVLERGGQTLRLYAAFELALINPSAELYNTRGVLNQAY